MGLWKNKKRGDWAYDFQHKGKRYGGRGFRTKAEARAAREKRRREIQKSKPIQKGMDFKTLASIYLDYAELKFAKKTYKYKRYVYKMFLQKIGNPTINEITPHLIHSYLKTRPSKHNYNVHRKELSALFNFAVDQLEVLNFNPVKKLDKMPHTPKQKQPPTEQQVLKLIMATEIYLHSIDDSAREAMRSLEGQFLGKTTTQIHYQNEDEKIKNDVSH